MKEKTVLYYEIGDFYVEAEWSMPGEKYECVDFWLGRKSYGCKTGIFGIPKEEVPEGKIENAFAEFLTLFCDRDYMSIFVDELTEEDEVVDDLFKIR